MIKKKCPFCSFNIEFPLRVWLFRSLNYEPGWPLTPHSRVPRRIICPYCKKRSYFSLLSIWDLMFLIGTIVFWFKALPFSVETLHLGGTGMLCVLASYPALCLLLKAIRLYCDQLIPHDKL